MKRTTFLGLPALAVLCLALISGRGLRRFTVEGRSMLQAFAPGDRVVVESLSMRWRPLRVSDVVVLRQPLRDEALHLKRIAAGPGATVKIGGVDSVLGPNEWFVLGDNLDESTDSRRLGPVRRDDIIGRFWFRY